MKHTFLDRFGTALQQTSIVLCHSFWVYLDFQVRTSKPESEAELT